MPIVSYETFILSLFVHRLSLFLCLGKAVLRDYTILVIVFFTYIFHDYTILVIVFFTYIFHDYTILVFVFSTYNFHDYTILVIVFFTYILQSLGHHYKTLRGRIIMAFMIIQWWMKVPWT